MSNFSENEKGQNGAEPMERGAAAAAAPPRPRLSAVLTSECLVGLWVPGTWHQMQPTPDYLWLSVGLIIWSEKASTCPVPLVDSGISEAMAWAAQDLSLSPDLFQWTGLGGMCTCLQPHRDTPMTTLLPYSFLGVYKNHIFTWIHSSSVQLHTI